MNQGAQSNTDHYLEDPMTSAGSGSLTSPPGSTPSPGASFSNPMLYNMDELLRMKRKEKHMAPIDCSGVGILVFNLPYLVYVNNFNHFSILKMIFMQLYNSKKLE